MRITFLKFHPLSLFIAFAILVSTPVFPASAQKPKTPAASRPAPTESNAAQIELLETKVRFEMNGDSRKEVHTRVRINNEIGANQFARLNFDFNRSFQSVEIPLVRITHSSGGTADILPSAITDNSHPAVVDFPAYHDVRVKSVRILGLAPGDVLEYRVITTTTHHPLAPDFWLDQTFDRSGVVSRQVFDLELPATREVKLRTSPGISAVPSGCDVGGVLCETTKFYHWERDRSQLQDASNEPDIAITTFSDWTQLAKRLLLLQPPLGQEASLSKKARELAVAASTTKDKSEAIYDFISEKISTVDLPLGTNGFRPRRPSEILTSGYATPEDKFALFAALASAARISCASAFAFSEVDHDAFGQLPSPAALGHQLVWIDDPNFTAWLDPGLEVAPFAMIPSNLRGKPVLVLDPELLSPEPVKNIISSMELPKNPPFAGVQTVNVSAQISGNGELRSKVKYVIRGDNELLLRVAFHKTEKEKWKEVAQMLALSDGFRGQITNITASDPYQTQKPFEVEYEISQPKFVDWSKKTLRIQAILPLPGLPDPPTAEQIKFGKPIDLGAPLTIELEATIELPAGATTQAPIGTTVNRDYATFSSKYSVEGNKLHASRSYYFLSPSLPASRAVDLNAFLHAVQSDQTQLFTITPAPQE
jgi:hypothetical protein